MAWLLAFACWRWLPLGEPWPLLLSLLPPVLLLRWHAPPWRRAILLLGWPLALLAQGAPLPAWAWALLLALLVLLYPRRLWRDAPLYLTPAKAFDALPPLLPLPPGSRVLDAGCGSGAALRAWRRAYPDIELFGTEASALLALWARWRCRSARVRVGNFWDDDWRGLAVVYLFQRPETMAAALSKARQELGDQAWLVSLDFALPDSQPRHRLNVGRHELLVYAAKDLN